MCSVADYAEAVGVSHGAIIGAARDKTSHRNFFAFALVLDHAALTRSPATELVRMIACVLFGFSNNRQFTAWISAGPDYLDTHRTDR
jgi:hypothetical protein